MIRIFKVLVPASVLILFVAEALLILACYAAVPYYENGADLFLADELLWPPLLFATGVILMGLYFCGLYEDPHIHLTVFLQQLMTILGLTFLTQAILGYWSVDLALPRTTLIWGSLLTTVALLSGRLLFRLALRNEVGARRVLFVGSSPTVEMLTECFETRPEFGMTPVGPAQGPGHSVGPLPALIERYSPDWIVVGNQETIAAREMEDFMELRFSGVHTEQAASVYEKTLGRVCAIEVRPEEVIFRELLRPNPINLTLQSLYSGVLGLALFVVTLPLQLVLGMLIKLTARGPVLDRRAGVGLLEEEFSLIRFRSTDAAGEVTAIGRFMRYFHLDALPQLWSVVRGEMSLVGPAPDRPEYAEALKCAIPFYQQRTLVRPGLTGWAQVHDFYNDAYPNTLRRLEYDLYYVKNMSPSLDFSVLLRWLRNVTS